MRADADYLERIEMVAQYGSNTAPETSDSLIDALQITATAAFANRSALLTDPRECLLANQSLCVDGRIQGCGGHGASAIACVCASYVPMASHWLTHPAGLEGSLMGLESLLGRYLEAARQLALLPADTLTVDQPYFKFIETAGRWDLHDGLQQWTDTYFESVTVVCALPSKRRLAGEATPGAQCTVHTRVLPVPERTCVFSYGPSQAGPGQPQHLERSHEPVLQHRRGRGLSRVLSVLPSICLRARQPFLHTLVPAKL